MQIVIFYQAISGTLHTVAIKKSFCSNFSKDRKRWRYWLFEAKKRHGLSVLNFIITSNHIHLLVVDRGQGEIARSMQLIAGRTAQEYNQRIKGKVAFWEDRYHATAVDTEKYLARCRIFGVRVKTLTKKYIYCQA